MSDRPSQALLENVITLLAYSDDHGKIVANFVDPGLFEGEYRIVAERCVAYWRSYNTAPKLHTADLLADILEDTGSRRRFTFQRILQQMHDLAPNVNAGYVVKELQNFVRLQRIKSAIISSGEKLNSQQEMAIAEVEKVWNDLLRVRTINFDPGIRLGDTRTVERVIDYLETQLSEFPTGIKQLDDNLIVPVRGGVMNIVGPTGSFKSWFAIHIAKHALRAQKRVCFVSLEMGEEQTAIRFYQSFFNVGKREATAQVLAFDTDTRGRIESFETIDVEGTFTMNSPLLKDELINHMVYKPKMFGNLLIKRFPSGKLSVKGLDAYLDNLEVTEGFIPDLLVVDHLGEMEVDSRDRRSSFIENNRGIRGICVERNMAGLVPAQANLVGANAKIVTHKHTAEAYGLTGLSDNIVTVTATDAEKRLGLARLHASKVREEASGFGVVIAQNIKFGQFALSTAFLDDKYFDVHLAELGGEAYDTDDDEGDN